MKQTSPPTPGEVEDRLYSLRPLRWYLTLWVAMLYVWALPFWKYSLSSLILLVPGYNLTLALMFSLPVAFIVVGVAALFLQQANDRVRTVKAHLASIYNELGVDSRAAAIAVAAQRGLFAAGKDNT